MAQLLAAADTIFATTNAPQAITMDAIALAAGVGKATLFRAFGSRDGLLDALWAAKLSTLREAMEADNPHFGVTVPPRKRAVAFLDAILTFKLENRHLLRAREIAPGLLQSAHYRWMHVVVQGLLASAAPGMHAVWASYGAHVLLAALHIDLVEEMLASGLTVGEIRRAQAAHAEAVMGEGGRPKVRNTPAAGHLPERGSGP